MSGSAGTRVSELEALVFGQASAKPKAGQKRRRAPSDAAKADAEDGSEQTSPIGVEGGDQQAEQGAAAAWVDDDDAPDVSLAAVGRLRKLRRSQEETVVSGSEYEARARTRYTESAGGAPSWAAVEDTGDGDGAAPAASAAAAAGAGAASVPIAQTTGVFRAGAGSGLPPSELRVRRLRDGNAADGTKFPIHAAQFHPTAAGSSAVLMTASSQQGLRFFDIDGEENRLLQSVAFSDLPVLSASFSGDGGEVLCAGRRSYFYSYDLAAGRAQKLNRPLGLDDKSLESIVVSPVAGAPFVGALLGRGRVALLDAKSKQLVKVLRVDGQASCARFSSDGRRLVVGDSTGTVWQWELASRRLVSRFAEAGRKPITCLTDSETTGHLVVGSGDGLVNIFDAAATLAAGVTSGRGTAAPVLTPRKQLGHLTTRISALSIHPAGEMLGMASGAERNAARMLHLPSMTVFANWPTAQTPLKHVRTIDFSPAGQYVAIGNDKGKVLLYNLQHYS